MQQSFNKTLTITLLLITGIGLYFLAPILTPFLVGSLLAYLVDPIVNQLMRLRIPRLLAVILVFVILFSVLLLLIILLIPLIQKQLLLLTDVIPKGIAFLQETILPWVEKHVGSDQGMDINALHQSLSTNWMKAGGIAGQFLKTILHSGLALFEWGTNLVLIPVVTFYLLRDWHDIIFKLRGLLPRRIEPTIVSLVVEADTVLSAFFRGQLLVMLSLGCVYSIGLMLVGLQIGLVGGIIAGLASLVPYLGFILGITTASIAAFLQLGTLAAIVPVILVFLIGQLLESMVLTPLLVGNRIGLHPVAVIFAILTGAALYGFFGILLALPIAAVVMVIIRFLLKRYRDSRLYQ